jgi:hypothetical protein
MQNISKLEVTEQWLHEQVAKAEYCTNATVAGDHFRAILDLAMRDKAYDISGLRHVENLVDSEQVELSGPDLRVLLMLATQAKRRNLKPRFGVVRAPTNKGLEPDTDRKSV